MQANGVETDGAAAYRGEESAIVADDMVQAGALQEAACILLYEGAAVRGPLPCTHGSHSSYILGDVVVSLRHKRPIQCMPECDLNQDPKSHGYAPRLKYGCSVGDMHTVILYLLCRLLPGCFQRPSAGAWAGWCPRPISYDTCATWHGFVRVAACMHRFAGRPMYVRFTLPPCVWRLHAEGYVPQTTQVGCSYQALIGLQAVQ